MRRDNHELAELNLATSRMLSSAMERYGSRSVDFDHGQLMQFLEDSLDAKRLDKKNCLIRRKTGERKITFLEPSSGDALSFDERIANSVLIWAILKRFPGYEKARLTSCLYDDVISDSIELYEMTFEKLSDMDYAKLARFDTVAYDDNISSCEYKIMNHINRHSYPISCSARKAYKQQEEIAKMLASQYDHNKGELFDELLSSQVVDIIRCLTGGSLDMTDSWKEDIISYELAQELFGALMVFYDNELKKNPKVFDELRTLEDVERLSDDLDMELKIECFLDGVPAHDIIA